MIKGGPKIINDGLVLCLDAHDAKSYAGEPTSNLIPNVANPNLSTSGWYSTGWNGNISTDTDEGALVLNATNGWRSMSYDFGVTNGTVTVQFDYKLKSAEHTNIFMIVLNGTHLGSYTQLLDNNIYPSISEYKTYKKTFTTTTDSKICIVLRGTDNAGLTDEMFVKNLQVESKSYSTPFVAGSRSATNGWVDRSGNSNSGTLTNMIGTEVTHYRDGQVIMPVANSYLNFDGSNDKVDCGSVTPDTGDFTIEFIYQLTGIGGRGGLFERRAGSPYNGFSFGQGGSGDWSFTVSGTSNYSAGSWLQLSWTYPTLNTWYHDVGVYSGGNSVSIYRNGSLVSSTSGSTQGNLSTQGTRTNFLIANRDNSTSLPCKVGLVRVYNKALTAAEVLSNYNATKERF